MKQKVSGLDQGKRVRVPGIPEYLAEVGSETSDAESPNLKKVIVVKLPRKPPVGRTKPLLMKRKRKKRKKKRRKKILTPISSEIGRSLLLASPARSEW